VKPPPLLPLPGEPAPAGEGGEVEVGRLRMFQVHELRVPSVFTYLGCAWRFLDLPLTNDFRFPFKLPKRCPETPTAS
jgi:hypothetical protein